MHTLFVCKQPKVGRDPIDFAMQQGNTPNNPDIDFGEFAPATYAEWRDAAIAALKGADFDKKLFTKLVEGITLNPIYNRGDVQDNGEAAGQFPYRRGTRPLGYVEKECEVAQGIPAANAEDFNSRLLHDLMRGQTAVNIQLNCKCGLKLRKQADWNTALKDVVLDSLPVYITPGSCGLGVLAMFLNTYKAGGYDVAKLTGGVLYDPVGKTVGKGSLCGGKGICAYYDQMAAMTKWAVANAPGFQTIGVSGLPYSDSGASAIEELSAMLSTAVAYLRAMEERGISIDDAASHMRFTVGIGANLFLEVAKIRALRELWASVVKSCGGSEEAAKIKLHARSSFWTISKVDPWVNMLRGTSQAFSAFLGGVDSLDILPFDCAVRMPDEFSRRIARNTQLILLGECNLDKVVDPAGGSWYIESLTNEVARKVWDMFRSIEQEGGIIKALQAGTVQKRVNATAAKRYEMADQRRQSIVGVNQYVNLDEKKLEVTEPLACAAKGHCCKSENPALPEVSMCVKSVAQAAEEGFSTCLINKALCAGVDCKCGGPLEIEPLPVRRLAERFESLLAKADAWVEAKGSRPMVFFANMGPLRQHKARADFSRDFLRAGGLDVVYPAGFQTPEEAAKAAAESGCSVCVICSTDDTYPEIVPAFCKALRALRPDMMVALAGYPADYVESFKEAGVDVFIHVRANCYTTLETIQNKIGL
ncbi:methylmalonyl-CoA mutase family protein [Akkermansia sp. N21116]|jgi:methylmalonyl-CoA mutase|uniref:methylmalonyl-CoA mutase family protein n=1 Tax=Akkermansia sp. N21116 TaxID=3040764 RepID=UPI002AC95184|nr:methylmalonyl-CoA mutase family protein [Akkermansia sp. N21116]WPX39357.1 methylmalonyl-CoA mutase family protein [Akkermansia sp. N21116]